MALFTGPPNTHAQIRQDINSFSGGPGGQREQLYNLMTDYINADVVQMHCNMNMNVTGGEIHSDFDFLPFHRTYIEGMEDYLMTHGGAQFVPLPKWDPDDPAPAEFHPAGGVGFASGVDPDCQTFSCNFGSTGSCLSTINWAPNITHPTFLKLPVVAGPNNDLCDWPMDPDNPLVAGLPDCCSGGLSRVVEGQGPNPVSSGYHNSVHGAMSGVMGNFRSPITPIFWIWHAYVDDIWKQWEMNCPVVALPAVDLYMKDTPKVVDSERDRGQEPNIDNGPMWLSEDIWIRRQPDGIVNQEHQDPDHFTTPGLTNYVYVRVRNRGSVASPPNVPLTLNWAKASTALAWPQNWDGTLTTPALMGAPVDAPHLLPSIPAGASHIEVFQWNAPDPAIYAAAFQQDPGSFWADEPWHFCLLARVLDGNPMPETADVNGNTKNNNNIVWKNISVVDIAGMVGGGGWSDDKIFGASVMTGDAWGQGGTFNLAFKNPTRYKGHPVTEEAEVRVTLEAPLWELWAAGGMQMENMAISREERYQLIVTGNPARLKNITYPAGRRYLAHVSFNFLAKKLSGQPKFDYDMVQERNGAAVGGERYHIIVPGRPGFYADAGPDKYVSPNTVVDFNAYGIGEPAIYNWYDPAGNLIHTGSDLSVSPDITTKYKLEVIAEVDGVKDYDEVEVKIKEYEITAIAPNPTTGSTLVNYRLTNATSAYLRLSMPYSSVNNQYILNVAGDQTTLNLAGLPPGVYNLVLMVNGQQRDVKNLTIL